MSAQDEQHLYTVPYERMSMSSNNYNDLINKPRINNISLVGEKTLSDLGIPTKTSELTNDAGFITDSDVPTKTSELTNDSDFTTKTYVDDEINAIETLLDNFDGITLVKDLCSKSTFSSTFDNLATNIVSQLTAIKTALETGEFVELRALCINTIGELKPTHTIIIDSNTDLLNLVIDWQGFSYNNNIIQAIDIVNKKVLRTTMTNELNGDEFVSYYEDSNAYTFVLEYSKYKTFNLT